MSELEPPPSVAELEADERMRERDEAREAALNDRDKWIALAERYQSECDSARLSLARVVEGRNLVIEECAQAAMVSTFGPAGNPCCMHTRDNMEQAIVDAIRALKNSALHIPPGG